MTTSNTQTIKLDQFLKWTGMAPTGGQAKILIQFGNVTVNGLVETRRGRKLVAGDRVTVANRTIVVEFPQASLEVEQSTLKARNPS